MTWAAAAWLWFYPHPYKLAVAAVAVLPLIAILVVFASRGLFRFDKRRNDAHPSVAIPFYLPGFALAIRLLADPIRLVDWRLLLPPAGALAVLLMAVVLMLDRSLRERSWSWLPVALITGVYAYATMMDWNTLSDTVVAHRFESHVLGKHVSGGRSRSWQLDLGPWGPDARAGSASVPRALYEAVSVGDVVCVDLRPGRMHIPWYSIGLCAGHAVAKQGGAAKQVARSAASTELVSMLLQGRYADLEERLGTLHKSYDQGTLDDVGLMETYRLFYDTNPALKTHYDEWVRLYPRSYPARLARGIYEKYVGRGAVGGHYLTDVAHARVAAMGNAFEDAQADLNASLALDAHAVVTYVHLIDLQTEGPGGLFGRSGKRDLLDAGLGRNPSSFIIRRKYMSTLETRRGHSTTEMEQFLDEVSRSGLSPVQLASLRALVLRDRAWVAQEHGDDRRALEFYKAAADAADEARELFERGIYADILMMLGHLYQGSENYLKALEQFDKLLRFNLNMDDTDLGLIWSNRGVCLWHLGDKAAAVSAYEKASELGDGFAENELGKHYWYGGLVKQDRAKAVHLFEEAAAAGLEDGANNLYWAKSQLQ